MTIRAYYAASIRDFLEHDLQHVLGRITERSSFAVETTQKDAWLEEIRILKRAIHSYAGCGRIFFEYSVPRMGQRIDTIVLIDHVVFVIEFKVGERSFAGSAIDQVWDYALDLKLFHQTSHDAIVAPILVATGADSVGALTTTKHKDGLLNPIRSSADDLEIVIRAVLDQNPAVPIDSGAWEFGRYVPIPTIIEAARALYSGHNVAEISRNDATATNLTRTSDAISAVIRDSCQNSRKSICFVTGVPGAGKTLVGLNVATQHLNPASDLYSVFLSGNEPLVAVLREALARDRVRRETESGRMLKKGVARIEVKSFIQNVHHFRDECIADPDRPPIEHVALFDEAQRAWDAEQTSKFMRQKKGIADFGRSEPEFLVSCLDRHSDWAVVVCLIGDGQEINVGEAGIGEWLRTIHQSFPDWDVYASSRLVGAAYSNAWDLQHLLKRKGVYLDDDLHLSVSLRSFRAESVAALISALLDNRVDEAKRLLSSVQGRYPIVLTRDLVTAKDWLRRQARGSERYGMIVSSHALRLKPHAIDVRASIDPIHWFLDCKDDVRSSYYLEDAATEFDVQGLELDWSCVVWDGDFRFSSDGWQHFSFSGNRWNQIRKPERQHYMKNAYRVLLTRARQGMAIVVPPGDDLDHTRQPRFYDATFEYLKGIGLETI